MSNREKAVAHFLSGFSKLRKARTLMMEDVAKVTAELTHAGADLDTDETLQKKTAALQDLDKIYKRAETVVIEAGYSPEDFDA